MPILITATIISTIFGGDTPANGQDRASFLNPELLREQLDTSLKESPNYGPAMAVADELDAQARRYNMAVEAIIEQYLDHLAQPIWSANSIIELLEPLDEARSQTLADLLRLRSRLLDVLTPEEWEIVFGS